MTHKRPTFLCDFCSVPGEYECHQFIWSVGTACRTCEHDECYRQGWSKKRASADNAERVRRKRRELGLPALSGGSLKGQGE